MNLKELFSSSELTRRERVKYRIIWPLACLASGAAAIAIPVYAYPHLTHDYGCVTTEIPAHGGSIDATLAARGPLGLPLDSTSLQAELTYAGQAAQDEYTAAHGGVEPDVGQAVQTCASYNPLHFGSGGWAVTAHTVTLPR